MKKLLNALASLITAALTFVCFSITCMKTVSKTETLGTKVLEEYTLWDMFNAKAFINAEGFTFFKLCAIITMVFAGLLVLLAIFLLLQHFASSKSSADGCLFNAIALIAYAVVATLTLIAASVMGGNLSNETLKVFTEPSFGLVIPMAVGLAFGILSLVFAVTGKKKRRR